MNDYGCRTLLNKKKLIIIFFVIIIIISLLTILNYDKIKRYFTNREWEIADAVGKIEVENYLDIFGTSTNLFTVNTNGILGFSENTKKTFEQLATFKEVVSNTAGDYAIIAEKNGTNVYAINKDNLMWQEDINNSNILSVTINKNGYSAVIYSQAGYKSLIRVYSSNGEELFTSYLASTYAIDVAISNDNKTLAIAEIDTNGVSLESSIKLINIQTASNEEVKKVELENDEMVSNIEFDYYNHLVIMTDVGVKLLNDGKISKIVDFKEENFTQCIINNSKKVIAVKVVDDGLFSVKCYICIYDLNSNEMKTYELEDTSNSIATCGDVIAIDTGNKIVFLSSNGNFFKKCEYSGQLKDLVLFHDGNMAALVFRNSAEIIKLGGI